MSTPATRAACLHSCRRSFIRPARWIMATEPTGINRPAITVCVILATLMQALDTTIANVALPHIQGSVSASQDEIGWVLTSYITAAAIMTPPTGFLSSRFGTALVPLSQAILVEIYPPEKQGSAMALWGMAVMAGPILGPVIGGWLTEAYTWRYVFYINVPIGVLTFLGDRTFLGSTAPKPGAKLDWFGFGTLSLAIAGFQI